MTIPDIVWLFVSWALLCFGVLCLSAAYAAYRWAVDAPDDNGDGGGGDYNFDPEDPQDWWKKRNGGPFVPTN